MLIISVDPGQARDPTAISVLERSKMLAEERRVKPGNRSRYAVEHKRALERLDVIHCERLPLHTPYPNMVDRVAEVHQEAEKLDKDIEVVLDLTGVGRPIRDMMRPRFKRLQAVTITSGQSQSFDKVHGEWHVPKRVLVSVTAIALQNRALTINADIPDAPKLVRELEAFKVKISKAGNDTYEAWRDGDHDDLVLATALGVWWANMTPQKWEETELGAEQRIKQTVIARNARRVAQRERGQRFAGGGRFG